MTMNALLQRGNINLAGARRSFITGGGGAKKELAGAHINRSLSGGCSSLCQRDLLLSCQAAASLTLFPLA